MVYYFFILFFVLNHLVVSATSLSKASENGDYALFMKVGKLRHVMPSASAEVTVSKPCSTEGGVLGLSRKRQAIETNKANDRRHYGATEGKW